MTQTPVDRGDSPLSLSRKLQQTPNVTGTPGNRSNLPRGAFSLSRKSYPGTPGSRSSLPRYFDGSQCFHGKYGLYRRSPLRAVTGDVYDSYFCFYFIFYLFFDFLSFRHIPPEVLSSSFSEGLLDDHRT